MVNIFLIILFIILILVIALIINLFHNNNLYYEGNHLLYYGGNDYWKNCDQLYIYKISNFTFFEDNIEGDEIFYFNIAPYMIRIDNIVFWAIHYYSDNYKKFINANINFKFNDIESSIVKMSQSTDILFQDKDFINALNYSILIWATPIKKHLSLGYKFISICTYILLSVPEEDYKYDFLHIQKGEYLTIIMPDPDYDYPLVFNEFILVKNKRNEEGIIPIYCIQMDDNKSSIKSMLSKSDEYILYIDNDDITIKYEKNKIPHEKNKIPHNILIGEDDYLSHNQPISCHTLFN